jgi:hypothetical protein
MEDHLKEFEEEAEKKPSWFKRETVLHFDLVKKEFEMGWVWIILFFGEGILKTLLNIILWFITAIR